MNRTRNVLANVLIVVAVALAAWWLLRGAVSFLVGLFWLVVAVAVILGILWLAAKVRGDRGNT